MTDTSSQDPSKLRQVKGIPLDQTFFEMRKLALMGASSAKETGDG